MKKLSKDLDEGRRETVTRLSEAESELTSAVDRFNSTLDQARDDVKAALDAYNEAVAAAEEWRDMAATEVSDYVDTRSEKWQEFEKAEPYYEWRESLENLDFSPIDLDLPGDVDAPDLDHARVLEEDVVAEVPA